MFLFWVGLVGHRGVAVMDRDAFSCAVTDQPARQGNDAFDTRHRLGSAGVIGQHLAAQARVGADGGIAHPRQAQVDGVGFRSRHLGQHIGARQAAAQQAPAVAGFQRGFAVKLDARNPAAVFARALGGEAPVVQIDGNAQLAADVNWLLQNLRWDVAADLERLFGPQLAQPLHQVGRMLASGLRAALKGASSLGEQWRARRA